MCLQWVPIEDFTFSFCKIKTIKVRGDGNILLETVDDSFILPW